ncbi:MAG: biopolymer transporter ExbD [Prevotellaceae bacterium]|jgi:biopolymer transport protein ExbD|nr:biopolymer transporter ExbD [Prevotellaceae bacterium]
MAEVNTGSEEPKKGKPQKRTLRVDFTPMVDMNMLLITFFMFCTTLSKPQMMNLVVPAKDKNIEIKDPPKIDKERTVTVILGADNKCYYYIGDPNYADWQSLHETDYSPAGLRALLVEKNVKAVREIVDLRNKQARNEIPDSTFKKQSAEVKDAKDAWNVMIKPTSGATFNNLVAVLDEMQICAIGRYAIIDMTDGDNFLVKNYQEKGALSQQAGLAPK